MENQKQKTEKQESDHKESLEMDMEMAGFLWQYGLYGWGLDVARQTGKRPFAAVADRQRKRMSLMLD